VKQLADGLHLLRGLPPNAINVYLAEDVLIDAATRQGERRIMRQLRDRTVTAHALTHAHPDHQGASHAICERLQIPLWCGRGDVPAMETPGGIKNSLFGGEGLFLATVTGPGKVWLQSLPFSRLAGRVLANAKGTGGKDEGSIIGQLGGLLGNSD